jgi:hypothetical protein
VRGDAADAAGEDLVRQAEVVERAGEEGDVLEREPRAPGCAGKREREASALAAAAARAAAAGGRRRWRTTEEADAQLLALDVEELAQVGGEHLARPPLEHHGRAAAWK